MSRWIAFGLILLLGFTIPSRSTSDEETAADQVTGTVERVYASPTAAWFSVFASPSKFQKLTPLIIRMNTGSELVHIHLLESSGLIPADHIVGETGPGVRRPANPARLQLAPESVPPVGAHCTFAVFRTDNGILYARTIRMRQPRVPNALPDRTVEPAE